MANTIMKLLTSLVGIFSLTVVPTDVNRPENSRLMVGDKINFSDDGVVRWAGLFLKGEYNNDETSGFFSAAFSRKSYGRIDYFQHGPGNQKADEPNFMRWNVKGGLNYNLVTKQNICSTVCYIKREPTFSRLFLNDMNDINKEVKYAT